MKRRKITGTSNIDFGVIQQGDVLMFKDDNIKSEGIKLNSNVIQEGEHTGHAHRLDESAEFDLYENSKTGVKVLETRGNLVRIGHEEHKTIPLPKNKKFRVGIVREYDPVKEQTRRVVD